MNTRQLVVIENGRMDTYSLDDKAAWEVGRLTKDNVPDIKMRSKTISRRHGRFENIEGVWLYTNYNTKNGTVHNDKQIKPARSGKRSVVLEEGDVLVFGGGEKGVVCPVTVWATFTTKTFADGWRVLDTKDFHKLLFVDGGKTVKYEQLMKGTLMSGTNGMAIYMGDVTYLTGNVSVEDEIA